MTNRKKAYQFFKKYPGHLKTATTEIATRLDVSYDDVVEGRNQYRESITIEEDSDCPTFSSKTDFKEEAKLYDSVNDYQQFLEDNNINEDDVVQVYYKQKAEGIRFTVQLRFNQEKEVDRETLADYLKEYNFDSAKPTNTYQPTDSFAVFDLFDAHIDKLAYTGKGGYWEAKENARHLLRNCKILLDDIFKYDPEVIVLPIGNDFFNTNDANPATKKGTPQPYTMHWEDGFKLGIWFYRTLINMIIDAGCKVHAINIPGNHDKDKVFHLGEVMQALFEENENVTLTMNRDKRKYVVYNKVLLGFGHGDIAKRRIKDLPTAMAIEKSEDWGRVNHRCWILGDIHHKEEYSSLNTLEHNGVDIKFLRPATSADVWHTDSLWISSKKSISYIIYRDSGKRITEDELFI